jgi:hypothetical protein
MTMCAPYSSHMCPTAHTGAIGCLQLTFSRLTPGRILYPSAEDDFPYYAAREKPCLPHSPGSWYALHVRSCTESAVADKLAEASIEAFYPHVLRKPTDQYRPNRSIESKFFPGYVFGRFEMERQRHAVTSINQVVAILGFGPAPVAAARTQAESAWEERAVMKMGASN